jgi:hypothetical protein
MGARRGRVWSPTLAPSAKVVSQFYQDINDGDYSGAWALGGDNIGGSDYAWLGGWL